MFKKLICIVAVVGLALALAPAAQAGTIAEDDPMIPSGYGYGLGDTFHLVFVTSTTRDATSTNIADYNAFVNTAANHTGSMVEGKGWDWFAIGSTANTDAITNTSTESSVASPGYPIHRIVGDIRANDYGDLWDGQLPAAFHRDEYGIGYNRRVWTGTTTAGYAGVAPLGATDEDIVYGGNQHAGYNWINDGTEPGTTSYAFYAMSEPLLITPEPATMALLGLGGLGLILGRKRR